MRLNRPPPHVPCPPLPLSLAPPALDRPCLALTSSSSAPVGYVLTDPVIQTAQGRKGRIDKVYVFFFFNALGPRVE